MLFQNKISQLREFIGLLFAVLCWFFRIVWCAFSIHKAIWIYMNVPLLNAWLFLLNKLFQWQLNRKMTWTFKTISVRNQGEKLCFTKCNWCLCIDVSHFVNIYITFCMWSIHGIHLANLIYTSSKWIYASLNLIIGNIDNIASIYE